MLEQGGSVRLGRMLDGLLHHSSYNIVGRYGSATVSRHQFQSLSFGNAVLGHKLVSF
jgi:hypothetical protein